MWLFTPARPKAGGIEGRGRLAVRPERLAVEIELGVELAGPPCLHRLLHLGFRDLEQVDEGGQVGRRRDDRADVEVAVGPAVEAVTDPRARRRRRPSSGIARIGCRPRSGSRHPRRRTRSRRRRHWPSAGRACSRGPRDRPRPVPSASATSGGMAFTSTLRPSPSAASGLIPGPTPPFASPAIAWWSLQPAAPESLAAEGVEAEDVAAFLQIPPRLLGGGFVVLLAARLGGRRNEGRCEQWNAETGYSLRARKHGKSSPMAQPARGIDGMRNAPEPEG